MDEIFSGRLNAKIRVPDYLASRVAEEFEAEADALSERDDSSAFADLSAEQLANSYGDAVREALRERTRAAPPSEELQEILESKAILFFRVLLRKNVYSELSTRFVFAGYGSKDALPALYVYDCDGVISGRVKRDLAKCVQIDPLDTRGHVEALAQSDVVKRYTEGIDPRLNTLLAEKLSAAVKGFGNELADEWFGKKGKRRQAVANQIDDAAHEMVADFLEQVIGSAREEERQEIIDVVHFMSKSELAQLAEALVEMTALRRRVSMDVETVGGPIDVAVISKGDGFVWIKRKHYFDPELNPRYFVGQRFAMERRRNSNGHASD